MTAKMGRPKIDNPKATQVTARLDDATAAKLEHCMRVLGLSKAEVLRRGIEAVYQSINK